MQNNHHQEQCGERGRLLSLTLAPEESGIPALTVTHMFRADEMLSDDELRFSVR